MVRMIEIEKKFLKLQGKVIDCIQTLRLKVEIEKLKTDFSPTIEIILMKMI